MSEKCVGRPSLLYHECCVRTAKLEVEVGEARVHLSIRDARVAELMAQLRDAQGQVAALAEVALIILRASKGAGSRRSLEEVTCPHGNLPTFPAHGWWCDGCFGELEDILADLPAASKAILAAAEREKGLVELVLQRFDRAADKLLALKDAGINQQQIDAARAALTQEGE